MIQEALGQTLNDMGDINPKDLPISENLANQLLDWASVYDSTFDRSNPISSGFRSKVEEERFIRNGHELGEKLKLKLGKSFNVIIQI